MKRSFPCGLINGGDCSYKVKAANDYICIMSHEPTEEGELVNGFSCDPIFWAKLIHDQNALTKGELNLLASYGIPKDVIRAFANSKVPLAHKFLADHLETKYVKVMTHLIKVGYEEATRGLAKRAGLDEAVYRNLAASSDETTRTILAGNRFIPTDIMNQLAYDTSVSVQASLAKNPSLPKTIGKVLSKLAIPQANINLIQNGSIEFSTQEIKEMLASHKSVREELAKTTTSDSVINLLLAYLDEDDLVCALAKNRNLNEGCFGLIYERAANNLKIAEALVGNASTPFEIVAKILKFYNFEDSLCHLAIINGKPRDELTYLFLESKSVSSDVWGRLLNLSIQVACLEKHGSLFNTSFDRESYNYLWDALEAYEQAGAKKIFLTQTRNNLVEIIG